MLRILVLGAAAGGGFPQWNCACANCRRARAGDPAAVPSTQSSIAVSADGEAWFLLNASPDLGTQIAARSQLHPRGDGRHSPIAGVVCTNADVDHITGLLTLRESQPLTVYGTSRVQTVLAGNAVFNVMNRDLVRREAMVLDRATVLHHPDGAASALAVTPFSVPGKIALWLEDPTAPNFGSTAEDTVGLRVENRETGAFFFYVPGCASLPPELADRLYGAPLVLFDGTTYTDDEMIRAGLGTKTAARMGHMAMSGAGGTIAAFAALNIARKIFIHINNSNPVLLADTPERAAVAAAGWDIAYDGMEITL